MVTATRFASAELEFLSPSDQRVKLFKERSRMAGAELPEGEAREALARRRRSMAVPEPEVRGVSALDDSDRLGRE